MTVKRFFVGLFLLIAALTLANHVRLKRHDARKAPPKAAAETVMNVDRIPAQGALDSSAANFSSEGTSSIFGWAWHPAGVRSIEAVINDERRLPLEIGVPRDDVKAALPHLTGVERSGVQAAFQLGDTALGGHSIAFELKLNNGNTARLGPWVVGVPRANAQTQAKSAAGEPSPFYISLATSNLSRGGAEGVRARFGHAESANTRIAVSVPVLYLRTTKGRAGDWVFDPNFDMSRKCGERQLVEDNLATIIAFAKKENRPILFTLNGGVWADAACDVPEWDINDELEKTKEFCQWNNLDQVMADDYLKAQAVTSHAPELGRVLSYNVYNTKARYYKKRNLQAAARIVAEFAKERPDLFVGVNLDSDTYMNPFFEGSQWYDYNPNTLKQFRQWLQGIGPYAKDFTSNEIPNLSGYWRPKNHTLDDISAQVGSQISRWEDVDPPRTFKIAPTPFWKRPWVATWEQFRRHVVDLHYDELSQWVNETGIAKEKIFSSQGFHPPKEPIDPYPVYLKSGAKNYDSGGMSIEGSVPSHGKLGAVLYGDSGRNEIRTENNKPLFEIFNNFSPGWGVVEFHPGHIHEPANVPSYEISAQTLQRIRLSGASFVSIMAWNGGSGEFRKEKGYVAFTVIKNTPLEYAVQSMLSAHSGLPVGAHAWGFGSLGNIDAEGWRATQGAGNAAYGKFHLKLNDAGKATLENALQGISRPNAISSITIETESAEDSTVRAAITTQSAANTESRHAGDASVKMGKTSVTISVQTPVENVRALRFDFTGNPGQNIFIRRIIVR